MHWLSLGTTQTAGTAAGISNLAQVITAATIGVLSALGAVFANRAARRSKQNAQQFEVPQETGGVGLPPGPVLAQLQHDVALSLEAVKEMRHATRDIAAKVEALQLGFAEHRGAHEGMMRDLERLMRKMYQNGSGHA